MFSAAVSHVTSTTLCAVCVVLVFRRRWLQASTTPINKLMFSCQGQYILAVV